MIGSLLSRAVKRSFSVPHIGWLWLLAIALFTGTEYGFIWADSAEQSDASFAALIIPYSLIILFALWKASRVIGQAPSSQKGAVGPWIGWNGVGTLLVFATAMILPLTGWNQDESLSSTLMTSLFFACSMAVMVPFFIHATGRAINFGGPSVRVVLAYCRPHWMVLIIAFLVLVVPSVFVSDLVRYFSPAREGTPGIQNLVMLLSGVVSGAEFMVTTALLVIAYEDIVAAAPDEAT